MDHLGPIPPCQTILDSLLIHIVALNRNGEIVYANPAWLRLAEENGTEDLSNVGVGANYLTVCQKAAEADDPWAQEALRGIRAVLEGTSKQFTLEYPCHSPTQKRWFFMRVEPLRRNEGGLVISHTDVSIRKRAEENLDDSEVKYRSLFEDNLDAVFLTVPNGEILAANQAACSMLQMTEEEICQAGCGGIVRSDDPRLAALLEEQARVGNIRGELTFRRQDGTFFPVEGNSVLLNDPEPRSFVIARDITERKCNEEAIRKTELQLRMALAASHMGVWDWDLRTNAVAWSPEVYSTLGIEMFDGTFASFVRYLHPEDADRAVAAVQRAIGERTDYRDEFRIVCSGGEIRWLASLGRAEYDDAGRPVRMIGTVQEITERKLAEDALHESQRTLRAVFDAATESILLFSPEGILLAANNTVAARWGKSVEELVGKNVYSFFSPALARSRKARSEEVLRTGQPIVYEDQRDNTIFCSRIVPVFNMHGAIVQLAVFARDITEQKRAEAALRESEGRYQAVLEDQTETISRLMADGTHVFVNDAYCRLFGKTRQELLGAQWHPIAVSEDIPYIEEQLQTLSPANPVVVIENRVYAGSGEVRWMQFVNRGFFDTEGQLVETQAVGRDITERKRAEESLREAEARLRLALGAAEMGVWEWDLRTDAIVWLPDYFPLGDTTPFNGMCQAFFDMVHADDVEALRAAVETALAEKSPLKMEFRLVQRDGQVRWLADVGRAEYDRSGQPVRMLGIVQDITERKRTEEALQSVTGELQRILDTAATGLTHCSRDVRYLSANAAYARWVGRPLEQIVGRSLVDVLGPEAYKVIRPHIEQVLRGERVEYEAELPLADGDKPIHVVYTPEWDNSGSVVGWVASVTDITARKNAEDQLRQVNATLEQRVADRTAEVQWRANQLQRLAAQMTQAEERERRRLAQILHDGLQQVLVTARMKVSSAGRRVQDPQAADALKDAYHLIEQTIAESRSLTKDLSPPVLYDNGLAAALDWLGRETERIHHLPVVVALATEMEPEDQSTRVFVFQCARELILNAVKHARASSLKISLSNTRENLLQVTVEDDGRGFDVEAVAREAQGGFGLFSIKERLEVIGGKFHITSSPQQGTTATIVAPYRRQRQEEGPADADRDKRRLPQSVAVARTNRIRVLLADDHPIFRKGLVDILREHPELNVVGEAADGQVALDKALQLHPDVILMDVSMPRMDGIEATRRIKEMAPGIQIIGLSMLEHDDMAGKMLGAGASTYLTKTSAVEALIEVIVSHCPRT